MIRTDWAYDQFGLSLTQIGPLSTKICAIKTIHTLFVLSYLDLCLLDLKFVPLVTLVQRYVSVKLEVSTAFLHVSTKSEARGQTNGRTDGRGATLNAVPRNSRTAHWHHLLASTHNNMPTIHNFTLP